MYNVRFEVSRVHTLTSVGPMRWDVIDGLVMETDMTQLSLLSASARPRRVLVRVGDVLILQGKLFQAMLQGMSMCVIS